MNKGIVTVEEVPLFLDGPDDVLVAAPGLPLAPVRVEVHVAAVLDHAQTYMEQNKIIVLISQSYAALSDPGGGWGDRYSDHIYEQIEFHLR